MPATNLMLSRGMIEAIDGMQDTVSVRNKNWASMSFTYQVKEAIRKFQGSEARTKFVAGCTIFLQVNARILLSSPRPIQELFPCARVEQSAQAESVEADIESIVGVIRRMSTKMNELKAAMAKLGRNISEEIKSEIGKMLEEIYVLIRRALRSEGRALTSENDGGDLGKRGTRKGEGFGRQEDNGDDVAEVAGDETVGDRSRQEGSDVREEVRGRGDVSCNSERWSEVQWENLVQSGLNDAMNIPCKGKKQSYERGPNKPGRSREKAIIICEPSKGRHSYSRTTRSLVKGEFDNLDNVVVIDGRRYIRPSESISTVGGLNVERQYMRTLLLGAYIDEKVIDLFSQLLTYEATREAREKQKLCWYMPARVRGTRVRSSFWSMDAGGGGQVGAEHSEKLGAQASEALGPGFSFKRLAHMPKVRIPQQENGHESRSHSLITSYLRTYGPARFLDSLKADSP
ncbi:hypothetical protein TIFTF001_016706 [Ficus carica]|uniref:Uncharacterized protein n=1 Tax=Ficus carica TaxID=3494 RepID=A0AA88A892_FICCA|nr:hypothetical protein TIFTF001_016706 [Ficus carica]